MMALLHSVADPVVMQGHAHDADADGDAADVVHDDASILSIEYSPAIST